MALTQVKKAGLDSLALDHVFTIGASGSSAYTFQGEGLNGTVNNPTLYLTRGKTYRFENGSGGHPIRIQSTSGASGTAYNTGVTNNAGSGTVIVEVQHDAPDVLYYQCTSHAAMNGILYITGALADGGVTTAKIADNAVTTAKILDSNISTAKITGFAVTSAKIANQAVSTAKIEDAAVTSAKIASGGVQASNMSSNSVTTGAIATGAVNVNKIADNAVTTAKIINNAVNVNKIVDNAVTSAKILDGNVTTAKIADQAVTLAKLPHGTSSNNGKFLRANNGADPTFETVNTDLVADTSPQLGGALDTNGNQIFLGDGGPGNSDQNICFGNDKDLKIYHDGANSAIYDNGGGRLKLYTNGTGIDLQKDDGEYLIHANTDGAVGLYYNNHKGFETTDFGCQAVFSSANGSTPIFKVLHGNLTQGVGIGYDSINSVGSSTNVPLFLRSKGTGNVEIVAANGDKMAKFFPGGAAELYKDDVKQLETTENGVLITKGVIRGNGGSKAIIAGTINPSQDKTWNFSFGTNDHGYNQGYIFNVKFYMNHWNTGSYYKYIESITGGRGNVTGLERVNLINNLGGGGSGWSNGHLDYSVSLTGGTRDGSNVSLFKVTYDADGAPAWTSGYYLEVNYGSQLGTINIT